MSSMENTHKPVLDWLEAQIFEDGPVGDVVDKIPRLDAGDAYRLRDALMKRRIAKGDRHIGYKVAGASRAIQTTEHVEGPMVGCLMHSGLYAEKVPIRIGGYKRVIVESEVAVLLKNDLPGPGVGITDVLLATAGLFPAIEVVASRGEREKRSHAMRIIGSKFTGGGIVIGAPMSAPHGIDLRLEGMVISINGEVKGSATGVEVMGHSLNDHTRYAFSLISSTNGELGLAGGRTYDYYAHLSQGFMAGKLGLQRIADTLAQEAVKVKQSRRDQRIDVVAIVEAVEHLKRRREHVAVTEVEWPAAAPVTWHGADATASRMRAGRTGRRRLSRGTSPRPGSAASWRDPGTAARHAPPGPGAPRA